MLARPLRNVLLLLASWIAVFFVTVITTVVWALPISGPFDSLGNVLFRALFATLAWGFLVASRLGRGLIAWLTATTCLMGFFGLFVMVPSEDPVWNASGYGMELSFVLVIATSIVCPVLWSYRKAKEAKGRLTATHAAGASIPTDS